MYDPKLENLFGPDSDSKLLFPGNVTSELIQIPSLKNDGINLSLATINLDSNSSIIDFFKQNGILNVGEGIKILLDKLAYYDKTLSQAFYTIIQFNKTGKFITGSLGTKYYEKPREFLEASKKIILSFIIKVTYEVVADSIEINGTPIQRIKESTRLKVNNILGLPKKIDETNSLYDRNSKEKFIKRINSK